jgi:hypothetical protein
MVEDKLKTAQKAQAINLDSTKYGTFAEIGAGQEVARWFFRVGGAAGTVAKSMSAYDMSVSDAIYGTAERYVSQERLLHMLDHEYNLLVQRLSAERGSDTRFFVYANTVAARSYSRQEDGQGWMGIRFQGSPRSKPNDIIMHVRLLDEDNLREQEAVGFLGVNLVHAALEYPNDPHRILRALLDNLEPARVEVGLLRFSGPGFEAVDNRLMALELVSHGLARATLFSVDGEVVHPTEVLHRDPIIVERGSFRPVTHIALHMLQSGLAQFARETGVKSDTVTVLFEMTLMNLTESGAIDHQDFLDRVDILGTVGEQLGGEYHVMVSNHAAMHRLAAYLFRYTKEPIGLVMGIPTLQELFAEKFSEELEGGILESFGRMFKNDLRLYVYPAQGNEGGVWNVGNLRVQENLQGLYDYLVGKGFIRCIDDFNEDYLSIYSREVLDKIRADDGAWEAMVPGRVAAIIKERGLLGLKRLATGADTR